MIIIIIRTKFNTNKRPYAIYIYIRTHAYSSVCRGLHFIETNNFEILINNTNLPYIICDAVTAELCVHYFRCKSGIVVVPVIWSLIFSHLSQNYLLIDWNHKMQVTSYRLQVLWSRWNRNEPPNWFAITLERAQKQWTLSDVNKSQVIIEFWQIAQLNYSQKFTRK